MLKIKDSEIRNVTFKLREILKQVNSGYIASQEELKYMVEECMNVISAFVKPIKKDEVREHTES
jgi:hypothetical protein